MMRLLKIGGSVITDKTKPYTALDDVISSIARAIKSVFGSTDPFILGHGGGSFPHVSAKKYGVKDGIRDESSKIGVGIVHYDATWINQIFMKHLFDAGVPAVSFHPNSLFLAREDEIAGMFLDSVFTALEHGLLPVVYGDVIIDEVKGSTIFSTEMILKALADSTDEEVIIGMAEKYGGVFTEDPALNPDAELIERIDRKNYEDVFSHLGGSHGTDVTGGMKHKVEELLALAREGIPSVIFKGTPENIADFLRGERVRGTYVEW